ncbi:MAG: FRG domain-containing protein [Chloroflexi bacterium]|nr:FRG domain-containing protein [Chloroflexota bacterium]
MSDGTDNEKNDLFEEVNVRCETALEFLDNLDLSHPRWTRDNWIFRGQNDARWELTPSLFREWDSNTNPGYEFALIRLFISNANLANLPIPNNSLGYFSNESKPTRRYLSTGLMYDFSHVVFAIAQHSGVPTRLLDFTHDPLIAAYFATDFTNLYQSLGISSQQLAEYFRQSVDCLVYDGDLQETVRELAMRVQYGYDSLPSEIAVWAVQAQDLIHNTSIDLLEHPFMEILPLRMQKGLFICETEYEEPGVQTGKGWQSLDSKLTRLIDDDGIYKLMMPYSEAEALRELLIKRRVYPAVVTPSYEAVAKQTVEFANEVYRYSPDQSG